MVPFTVAPSTCWVKRMSLDTTEARKVMEKWASPAEWHAACAQPTRGFVGKAAQGLCLSKQGTQGGSQWSAGKPAAVRCASILSQASSTSGSSASPYRVTTCRVAGGRLAPGDSSGAQAHLGATPN